MKIGTLIIGIIIIVALVWLGVWWYQNGYTGPVVNNTTGNPVTNNTTGGDIGNLLNNVITPIIGQNKEVVMRNLAFNPKEIIIAKGSTVTFKNEDVVIHNVVFADGQTSGNLSLGATYSRTFNTTGEFSYSCGIHPTMTGKVTVQ